MHPDCTLFWAIRGQSLVPANPSPWHICWDEPPAQIGLDSRALRHLRETGRSMSRRNYRQACKAVGVAQ